VLNARHSTTPTDAYRKVVLVASLLCTAVVLVSFFAKEQPADTYVLKKADRLVRTVGTPMPAN
jgi:hypothetical protein